MIINMILIRIVMYARPVNISFQVKSIYQSKKNQFTIYNELREVNANLNSLSSSMSEAIDSIHSIEKENKRKNERLDTISHNTAVTAYYSKINAYYSKKTAETSQAIGWLVALK